jgi:Xaa-Pro aminopeptidase
VLVSGPEEFEDDVEVVDGLPVVAEPRAVESARPLVPARQAAALAATGFVAGAATVAVVHLRRSRVARKRRKARGIGEIMASNSFLVDVHLIKRD